MNPFLSPEITVKELLDHYPRLLQSFMDLGLLCAGCPTEAFHTLDDVAKEYGHDPKELIQYFQRLIDATDASDLPKPSSCA
ncbi:MAG: DUF1858 domain-containing protein [Pseudomonadota bacterium]